MAVVQERVETRAPTPQRVKPPRRDGWRRRLPLLPALVFTIVVTQLPFAFTIWYSFQSYDLLQPDSRGFIGLANYLEIFSEQIFRAATVNTVVMTASSVILSMVIGVCLALLLDRTFLGRGVVRTLLIAPFLVMPAAAALLWKTTMLDPEFGIINFVLSPFGVDSLNWAAQFPMATIITVLTWQWTPFMMLIVLAGLQSQSTDILEAARVDGAGAFATFRRITLPLLRPYIELSILLGSIYLVQVFDAVYMITQGGPGTASTNLPYYIYLEAFRAFDIGQAAALGVVVVIATIIIATFALRLISSLFRMEEGLT